MDESMMEELSTEEKARRYDEAIKNAKDVYTYYCDDAEQLRKIEHIFPELKESEDEKIKNVMLHHFKNKKKECWCSVPITDIISWLEKQGEQNYKPTWKPSEEQMQALKEACDKRWEPDGLDPLYTLWEQLKNL